MNTSFHLTARGTPPILMGGPVPPSYTNPSLTANLICRVLFGILANLACLVPLQLLYRNGEFAAALFIINVEMQNLRNIVNSLIWRNDDMASWWPGYGLCDFDPYLHNFGIGLFATCLLAIMRNLAIQVGSLRANPLTRKEKQRRNIVQALIIFPLPLLQVAWTYPLTQQRYYVGTLFGCSWLNAPTWPYIVFEVLPPALVSLATTGYAILIYIRFREISKTTQSALSNNRLAHARNQRARRRLYLMVISILIPFLPIVLALTVANIIIASPLQPFDFNAIHNHGQGELPWNAIVYLPSSKITWAYMNICYIPIATAIPIFVFFGMTKDAMNCYRVILLYVGFGKAFPRLYEEYDPDSRVLASLSHGGSSNYTTSTRSSKKNKNSSAALTNICSNQVAPPTLQRPPTTVLPLHNQDVPIQIPHRNPFLFRTRLNFSLPFKISLFKLPEDNVSSTPLEPLSHQPTHRSVWSDEESRLFVPSSATATASALKQTPSNDDSNKNNSEKGYPTIMSLPPALILETTTNQADGQGEH
ncbi:pheromone receptor [Trichoderma arundinaceum]|uniref:Pheromone receptor n=1 Tax=Trichoderma arundinaceum TaxID=490622 RepID=A0A395NW02_TRIAR|nr:pheromone receptor [Trichoderma arundinaceum]